jgi:hypothetical protein
MKDSSVLDTAPVYQRDNVQDSKSVMLSNHEIQISSVQGPGGSKVRGIISIIIQQYIMQKLEKGREDSPRQPPCVGQRSPSAFLRFGTLPKVFFAAENSSCRLAM